MPTAIVVSGTVAEVEVAVGLALLAAFSADSRKEHRALGVVAGSKAFRIEVIDQAIVVVVGAIAASSDSTFTLNEEALRDATVSVGNRDTTVRQRTDAPHAGARRRHRTVDELDAPIATLRTTGHVVIAASSGCKRKQTCQRT